MSRVAVSSVRIATTDEAGAVAPGGISRVIACHSVYTATGAVSNGPLLSIGATGFLIVGVEGITACRLEANAEIPSNTPDQVVVLANGQQYIPARAGARLTLIALT